MPAKEQAHGFAAGTLVHTDMGLIPIEQVRIGGRVWSRPQDDAGAPPAWRQVLKVSAFGEQEPFLFHCHRPVDNLFIFFAMQEQLFRAEGGGWIGFEQLECGSKLDVLEGPAAMLVCAEPIYQTLEPQVGWVDGVWGCRSYDNAGHRIDLRHPGRIGIGSEQDWNLDCWGEDGRGFPFRMRVFALEIEEFHSYFVSAQGLWVHDGSGNT